MKGLSRTVKEKARVCGAFVEADEGTRALDLLHGKRLEANAWHGSAKTTDELLGAVHRLAQTLRLHGDEFVDVSERLLAGITPAA